MTATDQTPRQAALSACLLETVQATFLTVMGKAPSVHPHHDADASGDNVSGAVSLGGCPESALVLSLTKDAALNVAESLAGFTIPYDSDDMDDVVGEMCNILAGGLCARLETMGISSEMSLPLVDRNVDVMAAASALGPLWFTYGCGEGRFMVGFLPPAEPLEPPEADGALDADEDAEFLLEFVAECRELIEGAEAALLALETCSSDDEAVNTVFRAFHTIKGTSACLGLPIISDLAHRVESLLERMRAGEIRCAGGYADLALRSTDMMKEAVNTVLPGKDDGPTAVLYGYDALMHVLADPEAAGVSSDDDTAVQPVRIGDLLVAEGKALRHEVESAAAQRGDQPIGQALVRLGAASLSDVAQALRRQQNLLQTSSDGTSVRIRVDRLDQLMNAATEFSALHLDLDAAGAFRSLPGADMAGKAVRAGQIACEIRELAGIMRRVPLQATLRSAARVARDLARKSGKSVEFAVSGEDAEMDRDAVEILNGLLIHMVRNSVDHGIETPAERERQGKPRSGWMMVSVYPAAGEMVMEVADDGRGLDRDKIIAKALRKGFIASSNGLSDGEVLDLIFQPSFSTMETVTDISGRGVGMDAVKRGIESIGGQISVLSRPGQGCTFTLRFPQRTPALS